MLETFRRRLSTVGAGLALTLLTTTPAAAFTWTEPSRVSDVRGSRLTSLHELAGTASALHLVHGRIGPGVRDDRLVVQRSTTGGRTWTAERTVFASSARHRTLVPNHAVAAFGDLVLVAWRAGGPGGTSLFVRRSLDGGRTWKPRRLLASTSLQRGIGVPALAISPEGVIASWTDRTNGRIVFRRSGDRGARWGDVRGLGVSRLSIDCEEPILDGLVGLAASGATIHLAWSTAPAGACLGTQLFVRTSRDGGRTWRAARSASTERTYGWSEATARGARLLLTLQRPDGAVIVIRSADRGDTFSERRFQPRDRDRALGAADVLLPGGATAWIVYADITYDGADVASSRIRFRASTNGGRTWGPVEDVVRDARRLREAANLAARGGTRPVVAFQTGRLDGAAADIAVSRAR